MGTLIGQGGHDDNILGNTFPVIQDIENINNFDKNKGNNNKIISIDNEQRVEGPDQDPENVSHASQPASDTIYRLGRTDIFACHYCRLKGDKWEMREHPCRGSKK
jgi:hypothetical protein